MLVAATSMKVTMICYMMAVIGTVPANIRPDIMPGKETIPTVLAESKDGCMPDLIVSLKMVREA